MKRGYLFDCGATGTAEQVYQWGGGVSIQDLTEVRLGSPGCNPNSALDSVMPLGLVVGGSENCSNAQGKYVRTGENADWPTQEIRGVAEFGRAVEPLLNVAGRPRWLFRGQSRADWDLVPSLTRFIRDRSITAGEAYACEKRALELFRPLAVPHLHELERDPMGLEDWWSVMQHYGVPTRVMDWTRDPFTAAFFAAQSHADKPGAVWLTRPDTVQQSMRQLYGSKAPPSPPGPKFYGYPRAPLRLYPFKDHLLLRNLNNAPILEPKSKRRLPRDPFPLPPKFRHRVPSSFGRLLPFQLRQRAQKCDNEPALR